MFRCAGRGFYGEGEAATFICLLKKLVFQLVLHSDSAEEWGQMQRDMRPSNGVWVEALLQVFVN